MAALTAHNWHMTTHQHIPAKQARASEACSIACIMLSVHRHLLLLLLQVLDARDPLACRCPDVERYIRTTSPNKRIVLLLNKMGE
jgi:hypothetical protein